MAGFYWSACGGVYSKTFLKIGCGIARPVESVSVSPLTVGGVLESGASRASDGEEAQGRTGQGALIGAELLNPAKPPLARSAGACVCAGRRLAASHRLTLANGEWANRRTAQRIRRSHIRRFASSPVHRFASSPLRSFAVRRALWYQAHPPPMTPFKRSPVRRSLLRSFAGRTIRGRLLYGWGLLCSRQEEKQWRRSEPANSERAGKTAYG
jgi:hypothetical protein